LDPQGNPLRDNDSGEDFLYMHRQMIAMANKVLAQVNDPNYPRVQGWRQPPPPQDPDYPVPPLPGIPVGPVKTGRFYTRVMLPEAQRFTSKDYLQRVKLGQLGSDIQFSIHNQMHMRWAARSPVGYRPDDLSQPVAAQWDSPAYNWLGDTYSSHVNSLFWKIHGWVDDRIEDWKTANNVQGDIHWTGTWTGPMAMPMMRRMQPDMLAPHDMMAPEAELEELAAVASILSKATGFSGKFRIAHDTGRQGGG
jgi:hypothetical protein